MVTMKKTNTKNNKSNKLKIVWDITKKPSNQTIPIITQQLNNLKPLLCKAENHASN
jgi:hypothetical protein